MKTKIVNAQFCFELGLLIEELHIFFILYSLVFHFFFLDFRLEILTFEFSAKIELFT